MRMDLMTLSLLMVAGTPALAMAQGCSEAEALLRAEATQLEPILTQMTSINNEYSIKQKLISDEYDYFYYYYGTKPDTSPGTYVGNLESEKLSLEQSYNALREKAGPIDERLLGQIKVYEAACAPYARTDALLNEYKIVRNTPRGE